MKTAKPKNLIAIIKANAGAQASIDNDNWQLYKPLPPDWESWSGARTNAWWDDPANKLASDGDEFVWPEGKGHFASCSYGGDLLEALAILAGIEVEGV